jgi:phosphonoacetate hydrolase
MEMRLKHGQRCVVAMVDGFGLDYYHGSPMPNLKAMARDGLFKPGRAVFPTLTNANNLSIVCGAPPAIHGVNANCYLDEATGRARFLEDPSFLTAPTLFQRVRAGGGKSALLTCKAKTLGILAQDVDFGLAAEDPHPDLVARYGPPPGMYTGEVNDWLWRVALDLLETRPDLSVIYVHTTDFPMHRWAPGEPGSQTHLAALDQVLAEFRHRAPDAALLLTADHGMNAKTTCLDLGRMLDAAGIPVRAAISPVADRLVEHHLGYGGVSFVYLKDPADLGPARTCLEAIAGVDEVLTREDAAARDQLMASRIGDLVVGADRATVFGSLAEPSAVLASGYRNHGSRYEADVPLVAFNPEGGLPARDQLTYNYDLTRLAFYQ